MKKGKIRKKTIMKIDLKKTIPILTITILLISTIAFITIPMANATREHVELVAIGDGIAEWTNAEAHTGDYSVKLHAPSTGDYGKIILPLEKAFADLTDFSCYVTADSAQDLPLLEIEIKEITEDVEVDGKTIPYATVGRINIASQPEDAGLLKTNTDITTWQQYGTHTGSGIDASAGSCWRVFYDSSGDGLFDESSTLVSWADIKLAFTGKATIKDFRVELRYPPAASTVYVDDIMIGAVTYELEPVPPLEFDASISPIHVASNESYEFTITTTNIASDVGINKINVTHPTDWTFNRLVDFTPRTWTVSYDGIENFTLTGPNILVDESVMIKVNMTTKDIGDTTKEHIWMSHAWDTGGYGLGIFDLPVDVDGKPPSVAVDHPTGPELIYYYSVGAGNRVWLNITVTEKPVADAWPEDPVTNMTGDFTIVDSYHKAGTMEYKYYMANTTAVPDGTYVFHFNITDSVGNEDTKLGETPVTIDNTLPVINIGAYDTAGNLLPQPSPPYGAFYMNATIDTINIRVNITEADSRSVNTTASWICINSTDAFTLGMTPTPLSIESKNYSLTLSVPHTSITRELINVSITDTATPVPHTESVTVEVKRDLVAPENLTYIEVVPINGGLIIYGLSADDLVGVYGYEIYNGTATIITVMEKDLTNTTWTKKTDYGAFSPGITVLNLTDYIGFVNITVKAKDYGFNPSDEVVLYTGVIDDGEWYPVVLYKGWNLVSLPLIPNSTASADVLSLVLKQATDVSHVYEYDQLLDSWIIDPAKIEDGKGYWFYMKNYDVLIVSGSKMPPGGGMPPTYTLTKGWVLAGFKSTADMTVADYLASVRNASYFKIIYIWDAATQSWGILNRDATPAESFTPGQGFWILMYEEEVLVPPTA